MGERYLIDTNILIDAQAKILPENSLQFVESIIDEDFTISFITYIEFLGYKYASKSTEEYISLSNVLDINKNIIDICVSLRRTKQIKLPDAIIAATAIFYNRILLTHNISDFTGIDDLKITDPYTL